MHTSASRVVKTLECPRIPAYEKKLGRVDKPGADTGKLAHKILQDYQTHGKTPDVTDDLGSRILRVLPLVPGPSERHRVVAEKELRFTVNGVTWLGYIDLTEFFPDNPRILRYHDYKSTSNAKYAHDEVSIVNDVQAVKYAFGIMAERPEVEEIQGQWNYFLTRGAKKAWKVETPWWSRDEVAEKFSVLNDIAQIFLRLPTEPDRLPRHYHSCGAYGGCPYRAECKPKPGPDVLASNLFKKEVKHMNLSEMMEAALKIEAGITPATEGTEPGTERVEVEVNIVSGPGISGKIDLSSMIDDAAKEKPSGNGPFSNPIDTTAKDKPGKDEHPPTSSPARDDELVGNGPPSAGPSSPEVTEAPRRGRGRPRKTQPDAPAPDLAKAKEAEKTDVAVEISRTLNEIRPRDPFMPDPPMLEWNAVQLVMKCLDKDMSVSDMREVLTIAAEFSAPR